MNENDKLLELLTTIQYGYNYWITIILMVLGLYIVVASRNLIKKLIGLALFQVSVLLLYVSAGYSKACAPPVFVEGVTPASYCNPLPHVLMLTAIVVGVSVMAVGLAIIIRLKESYGTIEEDEMLMLDEQRYRKQGEHHGIE